MVFVVITNIVSEPVKGPIVAVRFLLESVPKVVFCYKVSRTRVQASSKEAAHDEVDEWPKPKVPDQAPIKGELYDKIEKVPFGYALSADEGRTEGVEYDLECTLIEPMGQDERETEKDRERTQRRLYREHYLRKATPTS